MWLPWFVWFGHTQYKISLAIYIINMKYLWPAFWVDLILSKSIEHNHECVRWLHHRGVRFTVARQQLHQEKHEQESTCS